MKENLKEYIYSKNRDLILVDYLKSYPNELINILEGFKLDFDKCFKGIINFEFFYEDEAIMKITNENSVIYKKIDQYLSSINAEIVIYHVTKLLDFEIEDIKTIGFNRTNLKMIEKKLETAFLKGYISNDMFLELKSNICLSQNVYNLVYCYTNITFLIYDSESVMNLNTLWGGETINWKYDVRKCDSVQENTEWKLKKLGSTCVLMFKQKFNDLYSIVDGSIYEQKYKLNNLIILTYFSDMFNLNMKYSIYGAISVTPLPVVIDVVDLNILNNLV